MSDNKLMQELQELFPSKHIVMQAGRFVIADDADSVDKGVVMTAYQAMQIVLAAKHNISERFWD